jgi:hypothetical protein
VMSVAPLKRSHTFATSSINHRLISPFLGLKSATLSKSVLYKTKTNGVTGSLGLLLLRLWTISIGVVEDYGLGSTVKSSFVPGYVKANPSFEAQVSVMNFISNCNESVGCTGDTRHQRYGSTISFVTCLNSICSFQPIRIDNNFLHGQFGPNNIIMWVWDTIVCSKLKLKEQSSQEADPLIATSPALHSILPVATF